MKRESIEEYLARGGKIKRLDVTERADEPHTMKQLRKKHYNARKFNGMGLYDGVREKK